jgi:hypothetical protein
VVLAGAPTSKHSNSRRRWREEHTKAKAVIITGRASQSCPAPSADSAGVRACVRACVRCVAACVQMCVSFGAALSLSVSATCLFLLFTTACKPARTPPSLADTHHHSAPAPLSAAPLRSPRASLLVPASPKPPRRCATLYTAESQQPTSLHRTHYQPGPAHTNHHIHENAPSNSHRPPSLRTSVPTP